MFFLSDLGVYQRKSYPEVIYYLGVMCFNHRKGWVGEVDKQRLTWDDVLCSKRQLAVLSKDCNEMCTSSAGLTARRFYEKSACIRAGY